MTKSEMKKFMKPIVKECLQEMLLQEGLLSNLIGEVLKGQRSVVSESMPNNKLDPMKAFRQSQAPAHKVEAPKNNISAARKQLADSIGRGAYGDIFEGITPAPNPNSYSDDDGGDPGIDLSALSNVPGLKGFK